jgi:UDP-3-O-[3-hydroxymyristoyl] glucosamine N-acyltransferase
MSGTLTRPTPSDLAPGLLIADTANIGDGCDLGIGCVIHDGVELGDNVALGAHVVIHPGTVLGAGCRISDNAVLGKPILLGKSSTVKTTDVPPLRIGDGTTVGAGTVIAAGSTIGGSCLIGDQVSVRERVMIGNESIVGRGSCVENDTTIGSRVKIQSNAYITAYMVLEDDVFIAPCVITTNDNFMGRTEKRFKLRGGPAVRRAARVGGGAVLLPNVEIGEEAFVGAGAVVTRDVAPRMIVIGAPARPLREVAEDELLDK